MEKIHQAGGDAIAAWYERKLADGYSVRSVRKIGKNFMEVAESSHIEQKTRIAFLRQNSVFIVPIIRTREGVFTILCEEYREGAGKVMKGFPAGSLDKAGEDIVTAAKRELLEETPIQEDWIIGLSEIDVGPTNYASPGGTNEQIFFVKAEIQLPDGVDVHDLANQACGLKEENEDIQTHIRTINHDLIYELEVMGQKLALLMILCEDSLKNRCVS